MRQIHYRIGASHKVEWTTNNYIKLSINGGNILIDANMMPATKKHPKFIFENIHLMFLARVTPTMLAKMIQYYTKYYFQDDIDHEVLVDIILAIDSE